MKRLVLALLLTASTAGAVCYPLAYVPYDHCLQGGYIYNQICLGQKPTGDPTCTYTIEWPLVGLIRTDPSLVSVQYEVVDCASPRSQDAVDRALLNSNVEAVYCLPKGSIPK